jgi:hypothetical protein
VPRRPDPLSQCQFEASDDLAAIEHAHSDFDESISLADQSPVIDEMGF